MIASKDRSGWFGASDTAMIMGNWNTKTFAKWWLVKLGILHDFYSSPAMKAGTAYEHRVLDALGVPLKDRKICIGHLRLRVNLDGEDCETISEVKTHRGEFRPTKAYWQQCQVQMFAAQKWCRIIAYQLTDEEYKNYFLPIDYTRISEWPVSYDPRWIMNDYMPRLEYLAWCLKRRKTPCFAEFLQTKTQCA